MSHTNDFKNGLTARTVLGTTLLGVESPAACVVTEFFVMRSLLMGRGFCEKRAGKAPAVRLRIWDGTVQDVENYKDPFNPESDERFAFAFHFTLPPGFTQEMVGLVAIVLQYESTYHLVEKPAGDGQSGDAFYASEASYWKSVHDSPAANVLEIGSRARSGISRRHLFPATCNYTGLDICAGENVTVVGDAHAMSEVLPLNHFDFVFSVSVWEHLIMPWKVSIELNKVMRMGGVAMINTHQSWPSHEEPWDYFRFSDYCWDSLFNKYLGFEIVTRGTGVKCIMAATRYFPAVTAGDLEWHPGYLATRCVVRKIGDTNLTWPVPGKDITKGSYTH